MATSEISTTVTRQFLLANHNACLPTPPATVPMRTPPVECHGQKNTIGDYVTYKESPSVAYDQRQNTGFLNPLPATFNTAATIWCSAAIGALSGLGSLDPCSCSRSGGLAHQYGAPPAGISPSSRSFPMSLRRVGQYRFLVANPPRGRVYSPLCAQLPTGRFRCMSSCPGHYMPR
jgi:hypothetical protein